MVALKTSKNLKPLINTTIGYVRVNKAFTFVNQAYECAAWSETRESVIGIYPIVLQRVYHQKENLELYCKVKAIVTDDYFPSLWAGNKIGNEPYVCKNKGGDAVIHHRFELINSIERTGNSSGDMDVYVNPDTWLLFIESLEQDMELEYKSLPDYWTKYKENDDQYFSNVGMVGHIAGCIEKNAQAIQEIKTKYQYWLDTNFMGKLMRNNISWVPR